LSQVTTEQLKTLFGFEQFRPHQQQVCSQVVSGRDVLLVMPTGSGKSLCYQLPAILRGGTALIVSPLIALMEDQVHKLQEKGFRAERFHSGRRDQKSFETLRRYRAGQLQFLFVSPEGLAHPMVSGSLKEHSPSLVVADEAHCISTWGHDFRPDYRFLGERIKDLRPAPVLAMTATATVEVQSDICKQLELSNPIRSVHGFRRDNIAIQVLDVPKKERIGLIQSLLKDEDIVPAIVYTSSRKDAEEIFLSIKDLTKASLYHAGMPHEERMISQDLFLSGKSHVIVATIAFGMGIDKKDVRTVIHSAHPSSVESYYQEIGRAGRDSLPARAIMLTSSQDWYLHDFLFQKTYPAPIHLEQVFVTLGKSSVDVQSLKETCMEFMEEEVFENSLAKLRVHRAVSLDSSNIVSASDAEKTVWIRGYDAQRRYKRQQLDQMLRYVQAGTCRMLSIVKHFEDHFDSGVACGVCDNCVPSKKEEFFKSRRLTSFERKVIQHVIWNLGHKTKAIGTLVKDLSSDYITVSRAHLEKLLDVMAKMDWIDLEDDEFFKDGRRITYRKVTMKEHLFDEEVEAAMKDMRIAEVSVSTPAKTQCTSSVAAVRFSVKVTRENAETTSFA
jgi:RecQ family ATP-dependent DNA helicase